MKKRIICLLAALLLLLGLSVSASAAVYANVIDTAELLSESEAEALDARCSELEIIIPSLIQGIGKIKKCTFAV